MGGMLFFIVYYKVKGRMYFLKKDSILPNCLNI